MKQITKAIQLYNALPSPLQVPLPSKINKATVLDLDSAIWSDVDRPSDLMRRKEIIQLVHLHERAREEQQIVKEDMKYFMDFCVSQHSVLKEFIETTQKENSNSLTKAKLAVTYKELLMMEKFIFQTSSILDQEVIKDSIGRMQYLVMGEEDFSSVVPYLAYGEIERMREEEEGQNEEDNEGQDEQEIDEDQEEEEIF